MGQLFWRSKVNREKTRFLQLWEIFSRSRTSVSAGRRIKLPFGSDRILLGSQIGRPCSLAKISNVSQKSSLFPRGSGELLFAKIYNVIANRTFPMECEGPSFLTRISNASQKSSLFLVWKEVIRTGIFRVTFGTLKSARPKSGILPKGRDGRPWKVAPTRFPRTPGQSLRFAATDIVWKNG